MSLKEIEIFPPDHIRSQLIEGLKTADIQMLKNEYKKIDKSYTLKLKLLNKDSFIRFFVENVEKFKSYENFLNSKSDFDMFFPEEKDNEIQKLLENEEESRNFGVVAFYFTFSSLCESN